MKTTTYILQITDSHDERQIGQYVYYYHDDEPWGNCWHATPIIGRAISKQSIEAIKGDAQIAQGQMALWGLQIIEVVTSTKKVGKKLPARIKRGKGRL